MHKLDEQLVQRAQLVLDLNWNGEYTQPGPRLYPHQWSWDSALIAHGHAHYAQDRATTEITHLFDSQWATASPPDSIQPPLRRVLPWHRLLARRAQPQRPPRKQDLGGRAAAHPRDGGALRLPTPKTKQRPRSSSGVCFPS